MVTHWDTHLPPRGSGPAQGLLLSAFRAIHSGPRRGPAWHQPPAHSGHIWHGRGAAALGEATESGESCLDALPHTGPHSPRLPQQWNSMSL